MHGAGGLLGFMSCNITEWHAQFAGFAGGSCLYLFFLSQMLQVIGRVACVASVAWPLSID